MNKNELKKLRRKIREGKILELTNRERKYLKNEIEIHGMVIDCINRFLEYIESQLKMLYMMWGNRDDADVEPELVKYRDKMIKGYKRIKEWMKEGRNVWHILGDIPNIMPEPPESPKKKRPKKIKK